MTSMKTNRIMISTIIGKLFRMVETSELIPGIELIVRSGLRILITLMAEMSDSERPRLTHPSTTTRKSSYNQIQSIKFQNKTIKCTYNIPRIAQVTMGSHEEAHSYDFEDHFYCIDE
jgi:hypothetical protein